MISQYVPKYGYDPYEELANAIIIQAFKDYEIALALFLPYSNLSEDNYLYKSTMNAVKEVEDWFRTIGVILSPTANIIEIMENFKMKYLNSH